MAGLNANGYAGFAAGAAGYQPPQPQYNPYAFQPSQPQYNPYPSQPPQPQYNPYAHAPAAPEAVPGSTQHHNSGTQSIGGKTEQSGTYKGHGTGASIQGGFTASGSIA